MTDYRVLKSKHFDHDIERIVLYLSKADVHESKVKEILETIYQDLTRLQTSPKIGAPLRAKTTIDNEFRYLVTGDYLIFYKVFEVEKVVRVYHVYHGRENYLAKLEL